MPEQDLFSKYQEKTRWLIVSFAKTCHLDCKVRDEIYKNPEKLSEYVPDDYRGEYFIEDLIKDMPEKPSDEFIETYFKAYLLGYKRGIGRFEE